MSTRIIYKTAARLFLGSALSVALNSALAAAVAQVPAQTPLPVGVSGAVPNIMIMVDDSGSMSTPVPAAASSNTPSNMPTGFTYNCQTAIPGGGTSTSTAPTIYMQVLSSGSPQVCTSSTSCSSGSRTTFSSSKCFNNTLYYNVSYYNGATLAGGPFLGLNLNWYFSRNSFTSGSLATSATIPTRIQMAQAAATTLINSLTPPAGENPLVNLGLASYDYDSYGNGAGGQLLVPIAPLTSDTSSTSQNAALLNAVNNFQANGDTPLATTLVDIGQYFATVPIGTGGGLPSGLLTIHPNSPSASSCPSQPVTKSASSTAFSFKACTVAAPNIFDSSTDGSLGSSLVNGLSYTNASGKKTDPYIAAPVITSYCQKNAVILISDGLPNDDRLVTSYLRDYTGDCAINGTCDSTPNSTTLPGASGSKLSSTAVCYSTTTGTGSRATTTITTTPVNSSSTQVPCSCSDPVWYNMACQNGTKANYNYESWGSDYLDDVAKAFYEMDLRPANTWSGGKPAGFISNITTYAIGIADTTVDWNNSVMKNAATLGGGTFQFAGDTATLTQTLQDMVANIRKGTGSFSAITANSSSLNAQSALFLSSYNSTNWTGSFVIFPQDPTTGLVKPAVWNSGTLLTQAMVTPSTASTPVWNTTIQPNIPVWNQRNIFTYNSGVATSTTAKGIAFKGAAASSICSQLTAAQQKALGVGLSPTNTATTGCTSSTADTGLWRLDWLRGDIGHEVINGTYQSAYNGTTTPNDPRVGKTSGTVPPTDVRVGTPAIYNDNLNVTTPALNNIFRNRASFFDTTAVSPNIPGTLMQDPWILGDIVNSTPAYVSNKNYGYTGTSIDMTSTGQQSYATFVGSTGFSSRTPTVYVGANDAMLHGFNANLPCSYYSSSIPATCANAGQEIVAYMPSTVFSTDSGLVNLSSPTYNHQYFVDGSPVVRDVYVPTSGTGSWPAPTGTGCTSAMTGCWHTVLVGTTGAGDSGIFALDVTTPDSFATSHVKWEVSDFDTPNSADLTSFSTNLGYAIPQPAIGRMNDGSWVAIVANGYASSGGQAVLYILNIQTGAIIKTFNTLAGSTTNPNGLSTPAPIDIDGNGTIDLIYAGDLLGNMWSFDVSSSNNTNWRIARGTTSAPLPLFTTCDNSTPTCKPQAITDRPTVSSVGSTQSPSNSSMIFFGTGTYFQTTDNNVSNPQVQSFYGVWDQCVPFYSPATSTSASIASACASSVTKSNLQAQTILSQTTTTRVTSNNSVNYPTQKGWYIDLVNPASTTTPQGGVGERLVSASVLNNGIIYISTLIPVPAPTTSTNICQSGSSSIGWNMGFNALTGGDGSAVFSNANGTPMASTSGSTTTPISGTLNTSSNGTSITIQMKPDGTEIASQSTQGATPNQFGVPGTGSSTTGAQRLSWRQYTSQSQ